VAELVEGSRHRSAHTIGRVAHITSYGVVAPISETAPERHHWSGAMVGFQSRASDLALSRAPSWRALRTGAWGRRVRSR
jgi:hypothetical protein